MPEASRAEISRFNRLTELTPSGCLEWKGPLGRGGYGRFTRDDGSSIAAHRFVWEFVMGQTIPDGMQIDHLCHTEAVNNIECGGGECSHRRCCNPKHLELVTPSENTLRQDHAERKVTHCPKGHEYTASNTIRRDGKRKCRTCKNSRW